MSRIIDKPFSWANKIVRAIFKGSPNLITTSDLNRQLEAFKKEMFTLQQSSGAVISDLTARISGNSIVTTGTYIFCSGIRFDIDLSGNFDISAYISSGAAGFVELRLYAKRTIVTYSDDFSREISGAKFADGTSQPAANHYVYSDVKVAIGSGVPDKEFTYLADSGYEYLCSLFRFTYDYTTATENLAKRYSLQMFTIPLGGIGVQDKKYANFIPHSLADKNNVYSELVPSADDTTEEAIRKLWSRQYTLEKRLFFETLHSGYELDFEFDVNGQTFPSGRTYYNTISTTDFGSITLSYMFYIVGNLCFVSGYVAFEKNTQDNPLTRAVSLKLNQATNQIPPALHSTSYSGHVWPLTMRKFYTLYGNEGAEAFQGYIDKGSIFFEGIAAGGANAFWSCVYPFSSANFWNYSIEDTNGNFNDRR